MLKVKRLFAIFLALVMVVGIIPTSGILTHSITNKRLAAAGYFEILNYYESLHLCD